MGSARGRRSCFGGILVPEVLPPTVPAGTLWENNMFSNCGVALTELRLEGEHYVGDVYDETTGRVLPRVAAALIEWDSVPREVEAR